MYVLAMPSTSATCEFFIVALPGLEDLVLAEMRDWYPDAEATSEHGGITVHLPLAQGLGLNLVLKTATRILIRVATFRCKDFPTLFKKVRAIEWKEWVDPACELEVHASTRLSRLKIKARIEDTCADAWMEYRSKQKVLAKRGKKQALYVRFVNDECTLSLDTSGERLHKRGQRQHVGEAPLRETIAAALLQMVWRRAPDARGVEIVDPMMGSGTFLIEAAFRDEVVDKREFAFGNFVVPVETPKLNGARPEVGHLVGFEQDAKTLKAANHNLKGVKAELVETDLFKAEPLAPAPHRWVFVNPPYGERLKVKDGLAEYYAKLFAAIARVANPEFACVLLPSKAVKGKFALPVGWKVMEKRPFVNGGIPVTAFVFGRV